MNSDNENTVFIDPDYVRNNTCLKRVKGNEENKPSKYYPKLSKVLSEIFDEELLARQKQLEETEEIICKAQKLLHLLRYSLVTSYYNKNSSDVTATEENTTSNFDNQNRIHPALKKLLGKNAQLDVFTSGKRRIASKICDGGETSSSQTSDRKKIKLENKIDFPKKHFVDKNQNPLKNRMKTQHRLIIGNISKWMPSLEEDKTTHKWMVYVRGEKETPDVSHIVEKVIFYLHPSYRPHDVVQVGESPFHLSRRGWGEFPLRVQIFFKCSMNKPISIVHNLKLDKTYTGRQTLGNETVVEVYLHDDENLPEPRTITNLPDEPLNISTSHSPIINSQIKIEEESIDVKPKWSLDCTTLESDYSPLDCIKSESAFAETCSFLEQSDSTLTNSQTDSAYGPSDTASVSFEHDYCQDGDIMEEQFVDNELEARPNGFLKYLQFEHSYCLPNEWKNTNRDCGSSDELTEKTDDQDRSKLIFSIDDTYLKGEIGSSTHSSRILLTNGHCDVRSMNYPEHSLKLLTSTALYESRYKVTLPKNKFKSVGEALPFLLKRFPLWNELSEKEEYKTMYPFVATSQREFENWNIGKKLNSEWNRAKEVKKILQERFPMAKKWNTKAFLLYARSHGYYCPLKNKASFSKTDSKELALIDNCFTEPLLSKVYAGKRDECDIGIDILSNADESLSSSHKSSIDISDPTLRNHCTFVREAALDCRIVLKSEEIEEGVLMNGAERMILEAVKCLAEGLIRRSKHHSVSRNNRFSGSSDITKYEVEKALNERSELRTIIEFQERKRELDFFI